MLKRLGLLSLAFCLSIPGSAREAGKIVAVVNDRPIAQSDFQYRLNMALLSSGVEPSPQNFQQIAPQILRLMIDEILQQELGDKFKIEVSDSDINRMIEAIEMQNNMGKDGLQKLFESHQIPMRVMRAHLKARHTWQEYIKAKYSDTIQISDQEIKSYLQNLDREKTQEHFLLAEIFLPFGNDVSEDEALKNALLLSDKIRKGAQFSAIAQEFSRLPSAARGGDLGWVTAHGVDPAVAEAIKHLASGQISMPIRVEGGFYVVMVRDRQPNGQNLGKDTLITFQQALFPASPQGPQAELEAVFLKAKSFSQQAKSCRMAESLLKNQKGVKGQLISRAPLSQMSMEFKKFLSTLSPDKASEPILSEQGFLVFWLCSKEDFNPQDPTTDDVKAMLIERRLSMLSQRELRNLHRGAVIDIRP